jgi:N-acetylglucosamine-6-phosphate deacetylase
MIVSDGLFDLQVNGFAGVDFNHPDITGAQMDHALSAMRATGVTGCLPTLITAREDELRARLAALDAAVTSSTLGPRMVAGYHIEGPFLNPSPGYAGCHPPEAMTLPEAALYDRLENGLAKPIVLVTLAPELAGSIEAIRTLRRAGRVVAMAHTSAGFADVRLAVEAGLSLSTHLGNSLPAHLHKVDNPLLAQLAETRLTACLIADGRHLSPGAVRALLAIKGKDRSVLVTDAVLAAAAPPARYSFAGMTVESTAEGAVRVPGQSNLAGSSLTLDAAVRNIVRWDIATAQDALRMASSNARMAIDYAVQSRGLKLRTGVVRWTDELRVEAVEL